MRTEEVKSGRIHVIAHVGCNNFPDTKRLTLHAQAAGADAMGFMSTSYYKPQNEK